MAGHDKRLMITILPMSLFASGALAQSDTTGPLTRILACDGLREASARLECFDREAAATRAAVGRHEIVVLDARQVEKNRRSMFGLTDPDQKILRHSVAAAPFVAVDSTVKSVAEAGYGRYTLTLDGGAVWRNVDLLDTPPPVGTKVHISKTPFGAYLLKMPNFQSVHATRIR